MEYLTKKGKKTVKKEPNRKRRSLIKLLIIVIVTAVLGYSASFGLTFGFGTQQYRIKPMDEIIGKGLDLVGGVSILEEIEGNPTNDQVNQTIEMLNLRLNKFGVSETSVSKEGDNRIRIEVPGKYDANEILESVAKTGKLTFNSPDGEELLTGSDVKKAVAGYDNNNQPLIQLTLTKSGTTKFAEATKKYLNQKISIKMDDDVLTSPTVQAEITDGKAQITGSSSLSEATKTAELINAGALPVTLKVVESKTVSGSLGTGVLDQTLKAGAVALALVFIFMIAAYRRPGILASISLILFVVLLLGVFAISNVTLTLAGIAGVLLTIGMALDANVLIFERTKEELKSGKPTKVSVDNGFKKALSSILDSNVTTLISGFVLYFVGTGSVKGFAMTLILGILVSIFTAITVTQTLLKWSVASGLIKKPSHFGIKGE